MAAIGGITCTFVKGDIPSAKGRLDVFYVPGINGPGAHYLGTGDSPFAVRAVLISTGVLCLAWANALQALQGTVVTIENDWATSYTNCLLLEVGEARRIAAGIGGCRSEILVRGLRLP